MIIDEFNVGDLIRLSVTAMKTVRLHSDSVDAVPPATSVARNEMCKESETRV